MTLKQIRMGKMLSRRKVAEDLGCTQQAIFTWETYKSTPPVSKILKLADYYGVDPVEVFKDVARI